MLTINKINIEEAWATYRRTKSDASRNVLVEHYYHLVGYHASRMHAKLPPEVQIEDLVAYGVFGLIYSIKKFDPERRIKFETYCAPRIRGSILDYIRELDWVPRLVRKRNSIITSTVNKIRIDTNQPGEQFSNDEIATYLKISNEKCDMICADSVVARISSLSRRRFTTDSDKDVQEIDMLIDRTTGTPDQQLDWNELFRVAVKGLSSCEQLIILLYYKEDMSMKEIGCTVGMSESRVSQIHTSILARLRSRREVLMPMC